MKLVLKFTLSYIAVLAAAVMAALMLGNTAFAMTPKEASAAFQKSVMKKSPYHETKYKWMTVAEMEKTKAELDAADAKRDPAATRTSLVADPSKMSPELQKFNADFLKITTAEQLEALLDVCTPANYDALHANDVKFVIAQMCLLKPYHGAVWRMIPVLDKAKALHSMVLTAFKQMASDMAIYLPTEQWQAGFDYITQPYAENGAVVSGWHDESDLQAFVGGPVLDAAELAATRIRALNLTTDAVVDNQIYYGQMAFQDGRDRYRRVGEIERHAVLAGLHAWAYRLAMDRAYSVENGMQLGKEIGNLYGWDGFSLFMGGSDPSKVEGVSAKRRRDVVYKNEFAGFGMRMPDGANYMSKALAHLRQSIYEANTVWDEMKYRTDDEVYPVRTAFARTRPRRGDARIDNMLLLVSHDGAAMHSHITGRTVRVNLVSFFSNPPSDLKSFIPTQFQGEPGGESEWRPKDIEVAPGKIVQAKYRDYFLGRPEGWNIVAYNKYLPDVHNSKDVKDAALVLSQSWGAWLAALPLAGMIN